MFHDRKVHLAHPPISKLANTTAPDKAVMLSEPFHTPVCGGKMFPGVAQNELARASLCPASVPTSLAHH